ncbi:MAG TPA: hypothetical protein VIT92_06065 [Burkholderiaceae bacterium]
MRALPLILVLAAASAGAQETTPRYALKAEEPDTGTRILRKTVTASVPPKLRYAELSTEQKQAVRAPYKNLAADDEPPFPEQGLGVLYDHIRQLGLHMNTDGVFTARVDVGTDGRADKVQVLRAPSREFAEQLVRLLLLEPFKPAVCKGVPCVMPFIVNGEIRF